ncbi:DUF742 domain-containing protein [Dactylosporangium sp. NPDC049742]|uniref:DUF742 domain-containing protein n=1 Tax=Dactylosporangium sp. NPDC049742 TaxID=3154737 RepID=UPI003413FFC7
MTVPPGQEPPGIRPYLRSPVAPVSPAPPAAWNRPAHRAPDNPRPYVLTAGRVQGDDPAVNLETQVTIRPGAPPDAARSMPTELQAILATCVSPVSVAEISAQAHLHLGVTKILVGDLCAAGFLDIHRLEVDPVHSPDVILRVIHGLRAIS